MNAWVKKEFEFHLAHFSDIQEHMGLLKGLAHGKESVVELGFRAGVSTRALLAGDPKHVTSIDIAPNQKSVKVMKQHVPADRFTFVQGDSREVPLVPWDLLFVDSHHSYAVCKAELERWTKAEWPNDALYRYVVLHDTNVFGQKGEDGSEPGLEAAIDEVLQEDEWKLVLLLKNCNGLTVLRQARDVRSNIDELDLMEQTDPFSRVYISEKADITKPGSFEIVDETSTWDEALEGVSPAE